ncbi:MAG: lytic transglycosylase domain-containing protein, partial [Pseudomonadota bacterium]
LLIGAGITAMAIALPVMAMLQSGGATTATPAPVSVTTAPAAPTRAPIAKPAAVVIAMWERLLDPNVQPTLAQFTAFLRDHPGFPRERELRQRAETTITSATPDAAILSFFAISEPTGATARLRHAEAMMQSGLFEGAIAEAKTAWRSGGIPDPADHSAMLSRFGAHLTAEDHAERADAMLWDGDRDGAAAMLSLLGPSDRQLVAARVALQRGAARGGDRTAATNAIAQMPATLRQHPGYIYDLANFYRETGSSFAARNLLADTRIAPGSAGDPDRWMEAHLTAARAADADGQHELAYRIASHHGGLAFNKPLLDNSAAERDTFTSLEWVAGWIALHDLRRADDAVGHFQNFANAAKFAATRARGLYWAGRAAEAAGRPDARAFYAAAARNDLTFYGQLAHEHIGTMPALAQMNPPQPSPAAVAAWTADPRVEAVEIYGRQGDGSMQRQFLNALAGDLTTERLPLFAALADRWGHERIAVLNTRGADTTGPDAVIDISWRRMALPQTAEHQWTMVHAITRQESQFEVDAVSPAGARGLMQLMRGTARETAGKIGLSYRPEALTSDRSYNIQLGSAYFANLVDYWGGNHVLAVASYNAGPGNVRKWVARNGDPRMPQVDMLKWIEEIPFSETRTYVRNVLENAVIYDHLEPQRRSGGPQQARLSWYLGQSRPG